MVGLYIKSRAKARCAVRADLGALRIRVDVPGVIDIFCAFLIRRRDAHVKDQGVLCKGHEVNLCVDDKLCPRHEIPVEDKEGVRRDVLGIWALVEKLREIFVRRHRQVVFALGRA